MFLLTNQEMCILHDHANYTRVHIYNWCPELHEKMKAWEEREKDQKTTTTNYPQDSHDLFRLTPRVLLLPNHTFTIPSFHLSCSFSLILLAFPFQLNQQHNDLALHYQSREHYKRKAVVLKLLQNTQRRNPSFLSAVYVRSPCSLNFRHFHSSLTKLCRWMCHYACLMWCSSHYIRIVGPDLKMRIFHIKFLKSKIMNRANENCGQNRGWMFLFSSPVENCVFSCLEPE